MSESLEAQLRALADRSVGEGPVSEEWREHGSAEPDGLEDYPPGNEPSPDPRRRILVIAAIVVVLGLVAGIAAWRHSDPDPAVTTTPTEEQAWALCPQSIPRRTVEGGQPQDGDALPELANAVTDRSAAEATLERDSASLTQRYPAAVDLRVGPGLGWAWTGVNGGDYSIVEVDTYGIEVRLSDLASCPVGAYLYGYSGTFPSAPLFFLYPADVSTVPTSVFEPPAPVAGWQLGPEGVGRADALFVAAVSRTECASGQSFDVGPPIIEETTSEVVVTFRPPPLPPANRTCPGNAPTLVEVHLPDPIGDRVLIDGGCREDGQLPPNLCERWHP